VQNDPVTQQAGSLDDCPGVQDALRANAGAFSHVREGMKQRAGTDGCLGADERESAHLGARVDLGTGVDRRLGIAARPGP